MPTKTQKESLNQWTRRLASAGVADHYEHDNAQAKKQASSTDRKAAYWHVRERYSKPNIERMKRGEDPVHSEHPAPDGVSLDLPPITEPVVEPEDEDEQPPDPVPIPECLDTKECSTLDSVMWVSKHLHRTDPDRMRREAPSPEAFNMWSYYRDDPSEFWRNIYARLLPDRKDIAGELNKQDRGKHVIQNIERVEAISEEVSA